MSVERTFEISAQTLICCHDSQLHTAGEEKKKKKKHPLGKQHINLVAEIYILNFKNFPFILFFHVYPITVNYYMI